MTCYNPLLAFQSRNGGSLVFDEAKAEKYFADEGYRRLHVPCGKCIGCRLAHSASWGARAWQESTMHSESCFLTLTFAPEHLPADGCVSKRDIQLFMKRLRKFVSPVRVRYLACGEYGSKHLRPHYHLVIFGYNFPDRYLFQYNKRTHSKYYRSSSLEKLWPFGHCIIGNVSFESCSYVARYTLKKGFGASVKENAKNSGLTPEFVVMSNRPGIGATWYEKFKSDVFPSDKMPVLTRKGIIHIKPARYYEKLLERESPELLHDIKLERAERCAELELSGEFDHDRIKARWELALLRFKDNFRAYENGELFL